MQKSWIRRMPRRQQFAPSPFPSQPSVSAALRSRDAVEGRASLGDGALRRR